MLIHYDASDLSFDPPTLDDGDQWNVPPDCTIRNAEDLMDRVTFVVEAMKEESWLPAALRSLVLDGFLKLRQIYRYGDLSLDHARETIGNMAVGCYVYNDLTMRSKTLRHVRVLDMELAGFRAVSASRS